jgi:gliding motility-associated-like protein
MKHMIKKLSLLFFITTAISVLAIAAETPPPCHSIDISGVDVLCYGDTNGSAEITISGGSGDYTITWSTGVVDELSIDNLTAGAYSVQVLDNITGCSVPAIITINQPSNLIVSLTKGNVNCYGDATGSIDLTVSGGTTDYEYAWSSGQTTQDLQNIPSGDYQVTVTDGNGCTAEIGTTINQPVQALGASSEISAEVLCYNDANAAIDVDAWGGNSPYYYQWNTGANSQDLHNIPSGDYSVTISDALGCSTTEAVSIDNPTEITYTTASGNNDCAGDTDGFVSVELSGGTEPYTYQWANSQHMLSANQPMLENLAANEFSVTVSDANGCSFTESFVVTSPDALQISYETVNVSQLGGNDGEINITVTGGTGAYGFSWDSGETTEDLSNIEAGTYQILVTDENGCSISTEIEITEPLEPLGFDKVHTNLSCANSDDGTIQIFPKGGVQPYEIDWSTGSTTTYLNNLSAGTYYCTLTDANEITYVDSIIVTQPDPISLTYASNDPTCFGLENGNIDLTVEGGTSPYQYQWYDPDYALAGITQDLETVRAGTYTIVVKDTNDCQNTLTIQIDEPEMIQLSLTTEDNVCYNGIEAWIQTTVSGGTPDYSYSWSNGDETENINNLPAGEYSVTVSDANDCEVFAEAIITEPDPIEITLIPTEVSCEAQYDGSIESFVVGGAGAYNYAWSTGANTEDIENLTEGVYSLTVTDIFECEASDSTYVEKNDVDCINIPSSFTPNGDGYNDTWIIRNSELFPECHLQVLNQWGSLVFESTGYSQAWDGTFNNEILPSGTYYYIFRVSPEHQERTGTVTILK